MKKWQFWLGVLISILFIWLALRGLKLDEFWGAVKQANYIWLIPGIGSTKATTLTNYIKGGTDFVSFDELASYLSYIGVAQTDIDKIESLYEKGLFVFGTPLWKK